MMPLHMHNKNLYLVLTRIMFPDWIKLLVNEACSSFEGIHYTPFSPYQLKGAKTCRDFNLYYQMRSFNHVVGFILKEHLVCWCVVVGEYCGNAN